MIYLCRHGQTAYNRDGRLQGQCESPLTDLGQAQAAAMGALLHGLIDDRSGWQVVASPLGRAQATAGIIADRLGLAVSLEPRLMEVSLGAWEGRRRQELAAEHPNAFTTPGWCFSAPGGETYRGLLGRVSAWLAEQAAEPDRRVIVVSHGVAGRLLRAAYAGLEPAVAVDLPIPQDAVFKLFGGAIERIDCA